MSDPKQALQEANGYLRTAERNMFSGKNNEAVEQLKKAEELGKDASQGLPNDPSVKTLFNKIEKMKKDLERKGVKLSPGGNDALPFEVQSHISRIRALLISVPQQPYLLDQAKSELKSYYARFAGPMSDIPEIKEINAHVEKLEKELEAKKSAEAAEKAKKEASAANDEQFSNDWYAKLKAIPYFDGSVMNIPGLLEHKDSYYKAFELLREFDALNFQGQKNMMLESLETDIRFRMKGFQENFARSSGELMGEVKKLITDKIEFLQKDVAWQSDPNINPYFVGQNDMKEIEQKIEELKPLFDSSEGVEDIKNLLRQLLEINDSRKDAKKGKMKMKSDLTDIADAELIKEKAKEISIKGYASADVKKIHVTKAWEFKHTEDWEDTSRTKWVVKEYYECVAQSAVKLSDGKCKLLTIHIEKPKGNESALIGHIMYEDEILEENIV